MVWSRKSREKVFCGGWEMCQAREPSSVPVTTTCAELMDVGKWMRAETGSTSGAFCGREGEEG